MAETEQAQNEAAQEQSDAEQAKQAEFSEATDASPAPSEENLDILLDINVPINVTLGTTTVPLKRLLQLGPGSVLQLDKQIGQPVDLYIQGIKFATADVVVVGDSFAIRIKEITSPDSAGLESGQTDEKNNQ